MAGAESKLFFESSPTTRLLKTRRRGSVSPDTRRRILEQEFFEDNGSESYDVVIFRTGSDDNVLRRLYAKDNDYKFVVKVSLHNTQ